MGSDREMLKALWSGETIAPSPSASVFAAGAFLTPELQMADVDA